MRFIGGGSHWHMRIHGPSTKHTSLTSKQSRKRPVEQVASVLFLSQPHVLHLHLSSLLPLPHLLFSPPPSPLHRLVEINISPSPFHPSSSPSPMQTPLSPPMHAIQQIHKVIVPKKEKEKKKNPTPRKCSAAKMQTYRTVSHDPRRRPIRGRRKQWRSREEVYVPCAS